MWMTNDDCDDGILGLKVDKKVYYILCNSCYERDCGHGSEIRWIQRLC